MVANSLVGDPRASRTLLACRPKMYDTSAASLVQTLDVLVECPIWRRGSAHEPRIFFSQKISGDRATSAASPHAGMFGKYGKGLSVAEGQILVQFPLRASLRADILSRPQLLRPDS